jgi:hypothetical protein
MLVGLSSFLLTRTDSQEGTTMLKLGTTFSLGVSLAFAAFQASVKQISPARAGVEDALKSLEQLTQSGVQLDPQNLIHLRLQEMIDFSNIRLDIIEDIRDNQLDQAYTNLGVPVLHDAYQLGVAIGGAEGQASSNNPGARPIIQDFANAAANFADSLSSDSPLQVPLNLSGIPDDLRTTANSALTDPFSDLHNSLLFVRGKCQGILDVTGPENF